MLAQTRIANVIDTIEYERDLIAKLDEACKKLLGNKMILAWILKGCMQEYENYDLMELVIICIGNTSK